MDPDKVGDPEYDPKAMFRLLVFSCSYGVKGSRRIERECHNNMTRTRLTGGLKPGHKTIAEPRRRNKGVLKKIFRESVKMCMGLDLVKGNVLFVDGTKSRAMPAGKRPARDRSQRKLLARMDDRTKELADGCEEVDKSERVRGSRARVDKQLVRKQTLRQRIREALSAFPDDKSINTTDPGCAIMRSPRGSHASQNVHGVADDDNGLVVHAEPVRETNDAKQFARQVDQANDVPGSPCEAACGDAGELGKEITVIAPSRKQALHHPKDYPFDKRRFVCYAGTDTYTCPEGHRLRFSFTQKRGKRRYRMENSNACRRCPSLRAVHKITPVIIRLRSEAVRLKLETRYSEESSRIIYKRRKTKIELFFGRTKRNLKTGPFLLRGTGGAAAEVSILALRFNLTRVTDIPGVKKLIGAFRSMRMAPA